MNRKKLIQLSTTQKIMLSFLCAILVGSILLALPISSATGEAVPYIDALFTATTSICVTGLVTVPTYSAWSIWGQIVILILIQLGGLRDHHRDVRCHDGTAQKTGHRQPATAAGCI